jgi:lysophospholipase L1-like esterase
MAPVAMEGPAFAGETLRMIAHVSIGGNSLRVRFSNAFGRRPLTIGRAHIARRAAGAAIVPDSDRSLSFGGKDAITIAAGALAVSDPVSLALPPLGDVAVTLYLPHAVPEDFPATGHRTTHQTNYISPPGDFCAAEQLPVARTTESWYFLSAVELLAPAATRGLVAFGDSLTDGNLSRLDANNRWPDQLARRLAARAGGPDMGIMNQGIGGNRLLHDGRGDSGLKRFDRDVLAQSGVSHVILLLGTNDLRNRHGSPAEEATAEGLIAGLQQLGVRARTAGLKIFAGTLLPYENETFFPGAWTPARESVRQAVNRWIRASHDFDAIIDFDASLRDPAHPTSLLPLYDCGDHLHPGDRGYQWMGDIIDLQLFD